MRYYELCTQYLAVEYLGGVVSPYFVYPVLSSIRKYILTMYFNAVFYYLELR